MAGINRYTNAEPARYNPMSLQELMLTPQYKRSQHDMLLEKSSNLETEIANINPLNIHSDAAKVEQENLYSSINDQVENINREGFNSNSKQNFLKVNRDYQKAISPTGNIGKINNAKKTLDINKKEHIDAAIKEGFTPQQALMNWQNHEKKYEDEFRATGAITPIGQLGNPKYVDYLEEANKIFKEAGLTTRDLAGGMISQLITTDPNGQYILNTGGGKVTSNNIEQLGEAVKWLNNNINDPNSTMGQSIAYQGKSPNQVLSEIGNMANIHIKDSQKNTYSRTMTGFKSNKELGVGESGSSAYTTTEASNVVRFNEGLINSLDNIIKGGNTVGKVGFSSGSSSLSPGVSANFKDGEKANVQNSLNTEQKEMYDKVYQTLVQNDNANSLIYDKYSPEVVQEVKTHMSKYANILKQDVIIQSDIVKVYGDSMGSNTKPASDIDKHIKTNKLNLQYSYDGKEYTYNELPKEVRLNFDKAVYTGYMSPQNFRGYGKDSNKELYVSPHVYTIEDPDTGKASELLVGRTSKERNSKDFKVSRLYNNVYQNTMDMPLKETYFPEIGAIVKYNPENEDTPYIVKSRQSGKSTAVDDATLQEFIRILVEEN